MIERISLRAAALALALACFAAQPARAAEDAATTIDPAQRQAIEEIVRDYIMKNPEIVIEALDAMRERERIAREDRAREALTSFGTDLFDNPASPTMGNPDGDIVVVEFFDYRCGYCRRMFEPVMELVESDGEIRFVLKEFPILGPESVFAARAALASRKQDLYDPFHSAMMMAEVGLGESTILAIAESVGLDTDRLRADMEDPAIDEELARNFQMADALAIEGTPGYVIGEDIIRGAISMERFQGYIDKVRDGAS
ncbi:MAG: DsbA family protein [Rhodospirillaceae bacterium]|jgi:protein-disulfide isomerase|nr:DsbA family protein [Rhodospirillaceae bacterium]MBT6118457.1 DsbA family protein [Rhodospirillaceae bacterium]